MLPASNPVTTGSSPIPGVDDIMGEYFRGEALIVIEVRSAGTGDAGIEGVVWSNEAGITGVPAGPADGVVQPAKDTAAMKMTRSAITLESIQIPWLADRINKT